MKITLEQNEINEALTKYALDNMPINPDETSIEVTLTAQKGKKPAVAEIVLCKKTESATVDNTPEAEEDPPAIVEDDDSAGIFDE